jgi:hypothetical protein
MRMGYLIMGICKTRLCKSRRWQAAEMVVECMYISTKEVMSRDRGAKICLASAKMARG